MTLHDAATTAASPANTVANPVSTAKWFIWSVSSETADLLFACFNWVSVAGAFIVFAGVFLVFSITPIREVFAAGKVADAAKAASDAAGKAYSAGLQAGNAQADVDAAKAELAKQKTLTAQAQLETERVKAQVAWRQITPAEEAAILNDLKDKPTRALNIRYVPQDAESLFFAQRISAVFKKAGWKTTLGTFGLGNDLPIGLIFPAEYISDDSNAVRSALVASKIPFSGALPTSAGSYLSVGSDEYKGAPFLTVGSRLPPKF
jgi:hypothetical protein